MIEPGATVSILSRLQRGLETLYRVETHLDVDAFVVDATARGEALMGGTPRRPREQLLIRHSYPDSVGLGLFIDGEALENLERHDPARGLHEANFSDFCLALEGVSHFVYVALRAAQDRGVSELELELQAEVDKFVSCVLLVDADGAGSTEVSRRLYDDVSYHDDLDGDEHDRYRTANDEARRYAGSLERRYLREQRVPDMLGELRTFYRLGLEEKLGHIARAA